MRFEKFIPTDQLKPYEDLEIAQITDKSKFQRYLKIHQQGQTDYLTFCKH